MLKEKTKKENGTNRLGTCKIENIINLINIFFQFIHLNKKIKKIKKNSCILRVCG